MRRFLLPTTVVLSAFLVYGLTGCGLSELDYLRIYKRAGWQRPNDVIAALDIQPGDWVADVGSGNGYFVPFLSEAVGPEGRVFAVDVEAEIIEELEAKVAEQGLENVTTVLGAYEDPKLPDGKIALVFLCNTYHHIEERPAYFAALRADLQPQGRVAVVDPDADLRGPLRWFGNEGHFSRRSEVKAEMEEAGYRHAQSFDFLPIQLIDVFTSPGAGGR